MRVLIADDHILFREGLVSLVGAQPDIKIVGEASSVAETIALAYQVKPDLILMDFTMLDGTGLDATKAILATNPNTKIIFLTVHEDDDSLFQAIRAGAKGYVLKNTPTIQLLRAMRGAVNGEPALAPNMVNKLLSEFVRTSAPQKQGSVGVEALSPRELEVLEQLEQGAANVDIAAKLFISENTVKNHIHNILTKLNLQSRVQLVGYRKKTTSNTNRHAI